MNRAGLCGLVCVVLAVLAAGGCDSNAKAKTKPSADEQQAKPENPAPVSNRRDPASPGSKPSKSVDGESVKGLLGDLMGRPGTGESGDDQGHAGMNLTGNRAADKSALVQNLERLKGEWERAQAEYRKLAEAKVPADDPRMKNLKVKSDLLATQVEAMQTLVDKLGANKR